MIWIIVSVLISALLTGWIRRYALSRGMMDIPNERSSHNMPTPRGGGISIVVVTSAALVILAVQGTLDSKWLLAFLGGIAVAVVGFLDDRYGVSAGIRIAVHFAVAFWALYWIGGLPPLRIGEYFVQFGLAGYLLGSLGIVWSLNLFNFMDGIDGIAASEAVFVVCAGAFLAFVADGATVLMEAGVFAAACCGFLIWNWPPAKIFMGDVGSGFIGYTVAILAMAAALEHPVALFVWLTLSGVFVVDATVTLLRRSIRGEVIYVPHRTHAYQHLARRWGSHRRVTIAVLAVNLCWLFPCALLEVLYPALAAFITAVALLPLTIALTFVGSGSPA